VLLFFLYFEIEITRVNVKAKRFSCFAYLDRLLLFLWL